MTSTYRVTFDTRLRLTVEVRAETDKEAHFAAFCDAAGLIQNDGHIKRQLASVGITVDRIDPLERVRITTPQESTLS